MFDVKTLANKITIHQQMLQYVNLFNFGHKKNPNSHDNVQTMKMWRHEQNTDQMDTNFS